MSPGAESATGQHPGVQGGEEGLGIPGRPQGAPRTQGEAMASILVLLPSASQSGGGGHLQRMLLLLPLLGGRIKKASPQQMSNWKEKPHFLSDFINFFIKA